MSLNSVQSFVIENCNGPRIENDLVCLHPLSRTFTSLITNEGNQQIMIHVAIHENACFSKRAAVILLIGL